jgi:hypothetical protein
VNEMNLPVVVRAIGELRERHGQRQRTVPLPSARSSAR